MTVRNAGLARSNTWPRSVGGDVGPDDAPGTVFQHHRGSSREVRASRLTSKFTSFLFPFLGKSVELIMAGSSLWAGRHHLTMGPTRTGLPCRTVADVSQRRRASRNRGIGTLPWQNRSRGPLATRRLISVFEVAPDPTDSEWVRTKLHRSGR